jgi:DNA-binding XRE family transcriptional regulator
LVDGSANRESIDHNLLSPLRFMSVRVASEDAVAWRRDVGANIRRMRRAQGLTQAALAQRAGLSTGYVSLIEQGRANPRLETVSALADALEASPMMLLLEQTATKHELRTRP